MQIALYEPDIPQNTGTILRLCACLRLEAHIIEPAGFPVTDRAFRRAGMDYLDQVAITRHGSFQAFEDWRGSERLKLVLLTTAAETSYLDHDFRVAVPEVLGEQWVAGEYLLGFRLGHTVLVQTLAGIAVVPVETLGRGQVNHLSILP